LRRAVCLSWRAYFHRVQTLTAAHPPRPFLPPQSGIVYCFSRRDCEATADALEAALAARLGRPRGAARRVRHYHAELDPAERERVQAEWTAGEVPVVCATVAFGMGAWWCYGSLAVCCALLSFFNLLLFFQFTFLHSPTPQRAGINKPDVRFVVHHSMPKSLEGFLQESGRAGRDGAPASCFLLYGRGDGIKQREMIERSYAESRAPEAQKRAQRAVNDDALRAMQAFCEEPCECRRVALLAHFGEAFSAAACRATCDNCRATAGAAVVRRDVSAAARAAVAGVRQVGASRPLAHVADVLRGSNNKRVRDAGHSGAPCFGALRAYGSTTADVERLLRRLVSDGVLLERTRRLPPAGGQQYGQVVAWLEVEERAAARLEAGALRVELTERAAAGAAGGAAARRAPAAAADATQLATQAPAGAAAAARPGGGARASRPALPLSRPAPAAAAGAPPPGRARARADVVDLVSDDGSDGEGGGAGGAAAAAAREREHEHVMRLMMRQLNAAAKARFGQKRAPFNGSVQAAIAAAAPASAAGVDALAVPGLSALIKRRYGAAIAAGVAQADAHLAAARAGGAAAPRVEDFRLDVDAALAEVEGVVEAAEAAGAKRARAGGAGGAAGWADSDGDWADTPPAAKAAAAGAPLSADAVLDGLFVGGRAAGAGSGGARKGGGGGGAGIAAWRPGPAPAPPQQQQVRTAAVEDVGGAFGDYGDADDGW
jgi:superfamily II DNA helicase RecQ